MKALRVLIKGWVTSFRYPAFKIQIVTTAKAPWGNYKSFNVVKTKWSVSKLYMTSFRYMLRNI
ncbi:MAG: hypothetical protein K8E24_011625 [Methanobacterium paludis]|nr:hypothetical protein [Methanobacterium paludis]